MPVLMRTVRPGQSITAPGWNVISDALNRGVTGVDAPRQVRGTSSILADASFAQFKIKVILKDYLSCVQYDGTDEGSPISVAKPYMLRGTLLEHNSVTFTTT